MRQYISNGFAAYPLDGMPYLQEKHLATVLDLSEKQAETMVLRMDESPEEIDFRDGAEGEVMAEPAEVGIVWNERPLLPLGVRGTTYFINCDYLKPITAEYKHTELWYRKTPEGTPYFAVKEGLMLVGIVMPLKDMEPVAKELRAIGDGYRGDMP